MSTNQLSERLCQFELIFVTHVLLVCANMDVVITALGSKKVIEFRQYLWAFEVLINILENLSPLIKNGN